MLLLSLKAGPIYGAIEDGRTMCGGVRYRSVSLDRHACATLLSLVWGADSPKTEHCLLTNWDACTGGKLLSRVLWVQVSLGAGGSERHVWGPQPYLMASLHARNFLFTEENFSGG